MPTVQWRPALNAMTRPQSYRIQHIPHGTVGYDQMAADLAALHPHYRNDMIRTLAPLMIDWIQRQLINGYQVTLENAFTFHLSFAGPMPPEPA